MLLGMAWYKYLILMASVAFFVAIILSIYRVLSISNVENEDDIEKV